MAPAQPEREASRSGSSGGGGANHRPLAEVRVHIAVEVLLLDEASHGRALRRARRRGVCVLAGHQLSP